MICRQQFVWDDTHVRRISSSSSVAGFKQRTSDVCGYKFQTIDNVEPAKVNNFQAELMVAESSRINQP